ncbi:hypothetical protein M758_4G073500 [Ceratodon purpureus]|nr:hypothetical protein M758_4G073500 [Ceratodon purpureus]
MLSLILLLQAFPSPCPCFTMYIYQSSSLTAIFRLASLWILPMTQQAFTMSVWTPNSVNVVRVQQQHHHQSLQAHGKRVHG